MGKPFPGPFSFKYFPWGREIHDCEDEKWCAMKSSQVGFTVICLNRVLYTIDIKRIDCLYLLPSQHPDVTRFSAGRFQSLLDSSPYLSTLFSETNNVSHKRAGGTNLYLHGTQSRKQLKSVPAGLIVFDELDEMVEKNLALASQRQSGQLECQQIKISTPTVTGHGISLEYEGSTQEHFMFKCPGCSKFIDLSLENLVVTGDTLHDPNLKNSYMHCTLCKKKLDHETKPEWLANATFEPTVRTGTYRGFYINGFYSSATPRRPERIAEIVIKAKEDPMEEQELYNSILGKVHEVKGARVNDSDIHECGKDFVMKPLLQGGLLITMGVDQGEPDIYYELNAWFQIPEVSSHLDMSLQYRPRLIDCGIVQLYDDLDILMHRWKVKSCVIDANPSKRVALEFAARFPGLVMLCFYAEGIKARNITLWSGEPTISVDRTAWLDLSLGRFRNHSISLPKNLPEMYKKHVKAPIRRPEKDKYGNPTARYFTGERVADHFAHARNYAEIALPLALGVGAVEEIDSPR